MNDERDNSIDADLDAIRRAHTGLEKEQPGETVDATIRRAARAPRQISRRWTAGIATAASIALAVIILPQLLMQSQEVRQDTQGTARPAPETMAPPAVPVSAVEPEKRARILARAEDQARRAESAERAARESLAMQAPAEDRLGRLRAELADADEQAWRTRLLALHADGDTETAQSLLEDFKERFDRPEAWSLEDLAAEDRD